MTSLSSLIAAKRLGAAVGTTDLATLIAFKGSNGNAAAVTLTADGKIPVEAGATSGGATEAKQDDTITALQAIEAATEAATPAGTNEIGRVNFKTFAVVGALLTRPANTTPYTANDSVSDNATAGSVTALTATVSDTNDNPVDLTQIMFETNDTGFANATIRVHIFNSDPTANSGVVNGDNAAWSNKKAGWRGSMTGTLTGFNDGAKGVLYPDGPTVLKVPVESGGRRIWYQVQVLTAQTPSASSTTLQPTFQGFQARP